MRKCRIGTAKFFTLLLLLYRTSVKEQGYNQNVTGTGFLLSFRITGGADFFGCALRQHSRSFLAVLLIIKAGRRFRFVGNMKFVAAVFTTGMMVFYIGCQRSAAVWAFKII
jgi:hypothetical protein